MYQHLLSLSLYLCICLCVRRNKRVYFHFYYRFIGLCLLPVVDSYFDKWWRTCGINHHTLFDDTSGFCLLKSSYSVFKCRQPSTCLYGCLPNTDGKEPRRGEKGKEDTLHASSSQSSNYFEIPTKEGHMANNGIHEIPTKDTEGSATHTSTGKTYIPLTQIY